MPRRTMPYAIQPAPAKQAPGWTVESWAIEGADSLRIELAGSGRRLLFKSLGVDPNLDLLMVNRRRLNAFAWAVALMVALGGVIRTRRSGSHRTAYVVWVLVLSIQILIRNYRA